MDSLFVVMKSLQDNSRSLEYYSLLIALVAVFFGPIMSYVTTRLTIRHQLSTFKEQMSTQIKMAEDSVKSQVLSKNRQEWINTLRDSIADFLSLLFTISDAPISAKDSTLKFEKLSSLKIKISLLINPLEDDHKKLAYLLEEAIDYLFKKATNEKLNRKYFDIRVDITTLSQKILKREWERVKKVE